MIKRLWINIPMQRHFNKITATSGETIFNM